MTTEVVTTGAGLKVCSNDFPETGAASASRLGGPQPTTEVVTTGGWNFRLDEHHRQEPKKRDEDD
ncbi:MAG: hypothetical protein FJZ89_12655 [Chloroflexi bacterium]|nr:hypothetical protein [Chloroflexota bacterium]